MLGLLLIYSIGKYFYSLALENGRHAWGYAILGVVTYYGGALLSGFIMGVVAALWAPELIDDVPSFVWDIFALPFGMLACWALYTYLRNAWTKSAPINRPDVLDSELLG